MLIPKSVCHLQKIVAHDSSRYAINGLHVERIGKSRCEATATDGRRLINVRWSDKGGGKHFPGLSEADAAEIGGYHQIIPRNLWERAFKAIPSNPRRPIAGHAHLSEADHGESDGQAKVIIRTTDTESETAFKALEVDGKFPEFRGLLVRPASDQCTYFYVNADLMAETLKTVADVMNTADRMVRIIVPLDRTRPIRLESRSHEMEVRALVQPVHGESDPHLDHYSKLKASAIDLRSNLAEAAAILKDVFKPGSLTHRGTKPERREEIESTMVKIDNLLETLQDEPAGPPPEYGGEDDLAPTYTESASYVSRSAPSPDTGPETDTSQTTETIKPPKLSATFHLRKTRPSLSCSGCQASVADPQFGGFARWEVAGDNDPATCPNCIAARPVASAPAA